MRRWRNFLSICDQLRSQFLGGEEARGQLTDWDSLIKISSQHLVTPALARCLKGEAGLPLEVADFFEAVLHLNGRRNATMRASLVRVLGALNASGIEPVLLKGAARLLDGTYPDPSIRFLGDLDILLPEVEIPAAMRALGTIGFAHKADDPLAKDHHHAPMLHERASGVGLEVHRELAMPPFDRIIPAAWLIDRSSSIAVEGARARLPDATGAALHNIVHDQLVHEQYRWRGMELRQLFDMVLMRAKRDGEIDWPRIDACFCAAGFGQVPATYLTFAQAFFGQQVPAFRHRPRDDVVDRFRRRSDAWPTLKRFAGDYMAARHDDRLGVVHLLDPSTWAHRFRRIKRAFQIEI